MMGVAKLAERQLFLMKFENLEKRVRAYYDQTKDVDSLIEYGVAILVRNFFCMRAFAELIKELIREVYFSAEPTASMRRYMPYFEEYFNVNEWEAVIKRLFADRANYLAQTEEARLYKGYLDQVGTLDNHIEGLVYRVEAIFEDTVGKKHKLTIRETDSTIDEALTIHVLNILTTLSIFDTAGVRKYATYVSYQTSGKVIATAHNSRQKSNTTAKETETIATAKQAPQRSMAITKNQEGAASTSKEAAIEPAVISNTAVKKSASTPPKKDTPPDDPTKGKSQPIAKEPKKMAVADKSMGLHQKPDTSYKRLGKNKEQIQNHREDKKKEQKVNSALGRRKNRKRNKRK